jgi:vacuolar protein sorting-associated protein 35
MAVLTGSCSDGGSVTDTIEFIIGNFTEMNKLWVRMALAAAGTKDKDRRAGEREELRLLVGKNLARLSQLDGLDSHLYTTAVLPQMLEQIVNCKEVVAQQYLMECLIQVFPDEFHIGTLGELLASCTQLQPGADVRLVLVALLDRLAAYGAKQIQSSGTPLQPAVLDTLRDGLNKLIEVLTRGLCWDSLLCLPCRLVLT